MTKVWAPIAKSVELAVGDRRFPMHMDEDGWWTRPDYKLAAGSDYQFVVDGEALPDPRSPWQPEGVHGPSRHVDHSSFPWTDRHWQARPLASAIVYELHVGTFTPE